MERAARDGGPLLVGAGRLSGKLLILRLTALGLWRVRRGGRRSAASSVSRARAKGGGAPGPCAGRAGWPVGGRAGRR